MICQFLIRLEKLLRTVLRRKLLNKFFRYLLRKVVIGSRFLNRIWQGFRSYRNRCKVKLITFYQKEVIKVQIRDKERLPRVAALVRAVKIIFCMIMPMSIRLIRKCKCIRGRALRTIRMVALKQLNTTKKVVLAKTTTKTVM